MRLHKRTGATPYECMTGFFVGFDWFAGSKRIRNPYFWHSRKWEDWNDGWRLGMSELTQDRKFHIDGLSYEELLERWRFAPAGDPWFQGETGDYWSKRMKDLKEAGCDTVGASKRVGWDK